MWFSKGQRGMVLCVVRGVVWYSVLSVTWYPVRGMALCVERGVVRHLEQQQNPNELRLLTHTNDRVWKI